MKATRRKMNKLRKSFFIFVLTIKDASNCRALLLIESLKDFFMAIAPSLDSFIVVYKKGEELKNIHKSLFLTPPALIFLDSLYKIWCK